MAAATDTDMVGIRIVEDMFDVHVSRRSRGTVFNPARGEVEESFPEMAKTEEVTTVPRNEFLRDYPERYSDQELGRRFGTQSVFSGIRLWCIANVPRNQAPKTSSALKI
jgi:hypothetical protein